MNQLNISVTEDLQDFINEQIKTKGYSNLSEYINYLIQKDREKQAEKHLEELLLEGLESPEFIEVNDQWWEEKRLKLMNQIKGNNL
ncbi:ribbon-helix-helix domain-containing protein [Geminocystis sp. CENA526]|uniref:ribbon-helix-helix domain-containing protein n=1 Tax=Geminocystis sp. CENA526 TaxID=1355871 RepID=UPI003D6F8C6F